MANWSPLISSLGSPLPPPLSCTFISDHSMVEDEQKLAGESENEDDFMFSSLQKLLHGFGNVTSVVLWLFRISLIKVYQG